MTETTREIALLTILIATCEETVQAFRASDREIDRGFVADLERIVARSHDELEALREKIPKEGVTS